MDPPLLRVALGLQHPLLPNEVEFPANASDPLSLARFCRANGVLASADILEIGGTFLSLIDETTSRCYDAEFQPERSVTLDQDPFVQTDVSLILANGVFEEGSGITRTLHKGRATWKELEPLFRTRGLVRQDFECYRRSQAVAAAVELFAWARNHLRLGGRLLFNNLLSPMVMPDAATLRLFGLELEPVYARKAKIYPFGPVESCVCGVRAIERGGPQESARASVRSEEIRDGTEGPFVVARIRTYEWTGDRIVAAWSTESRSPLRSGAWS